MLTISKVKDNSSLTITAVKRGDKRAFRTIYEKHVKFLRSFVNSYTNNSSKTEDILQDTFLKLWLTKTSLDETKPIQSFLFKMAYNIFIDKYRKEQIETNLLDGWIYKHLMEMTKDNEKEKEKKIILVKNAVKKLPPRCREIFIMSKFNQLSYQEIANILGVSVKTVEVQVRKAFKHIKKDICKKEKLFFAI